MDAPGYCTRGCEMQGLSVFYNDTVTVYNRILDVDSENETWLPSVLEKVNLVVTKGANVSKSGIEDADSAKLKIIAPVQLQKYVQPKEWKCMDQQEKENHFTFTSGEDFYVEGDVSEEPIPEEGFYEYMRNRYDNVFRVTNVDHYKDIMPHLEVGGK